MYIAHHQIVLTGYLVFIDADLFLYGFYDISYHVLQNVFGYVSLIISKHDTT